jgi:hypothetical protein
MFWFNGDRFIAGIFSRPATLSSTYTGESLEPDYFCSISWGETELAVL